jgi:SPP1 family phage portal protein
MDIKAIEKLISGDALRQRKIECQKRYAGGYNVAILGRAAHEEPDSRIPLPIARKGIRFVTGYMAKPGQIVYSSEDGYADTTLMPIFDTNDEQLLTQELFETALTHGEAWEYHYTQDGEKRFVEVPYGQCVPIWNNELPPKLVGMIRYYKEKDEEGGDKAEVYFYDGTSITKYEGKDFNSLELSVESEHAYGEVPFVQYKISRDCSNLFDCVLPLIDEFDRVVSEDHANEARRFANSYLLLRNRLNTERDEEGKTELDRLKETRTFEDLGENVNTAVSFLTKNIPIEFIKNTTETFERLIYDMMQIINPNNVADTGEISGVALAYKLLQFEYFCASCEAYFSRGLQWRIRLIQNVSGNMKAKPQDRPQVDILFRRNLPFDMQSAVDQFTKLSGKELPTEIALKVFPADFIPDPAQTAKEMDDKAQEDADIFAENMKASKEANPIDNTTKEVNADA